MTYPLLVTKIVLDEAKILRENKYNLEKMCQTIDEITKESGLIKVNKLTYHCKGNENDLGCMGVFNFTNLVHCEWLTLNIKEWTWISEKEGNSDLIANSKKHNMGIWQ